MAIYSHGVLTKKGQALIAKSETRHVGIELTKAVTGAGFHADSSPEVLEQCTELTEPVQEFAFSDLSTVEGNNGLAVITVVIHNRGLKKLYHLNELGVYAKDPDEGEILYMILTSDEELIYMPPDNQTGGISAITERIYVEVVNSDLTSINMDGAVVSATEYLALKHIVQDVVANLKAGTEGQILTKDGSDPYAYTWKDINTVTRPFDEFPDEGRVDAVYIDSDSAEVYIWKKLADTGKMGYFKLPLGSEASATLQKQISDNAANIASLTNRVAKLEKMHTETYILIDDVWDSSEEDGVIVYKKEIPLDGMTKDFSGTVYPSIHSTKASEIVEELKAAAVFFGRGVSDSEDKKIVLTCYGKVPKSAFGLCIQGT